MRKLISISAVAIAVLALVPAAALAAGSYTNSASYTGQGLNSNPDGFGGFDLNKEICGVENGADMDGPYLLFVMTATGAKQADITFSDEAATGLDAGTHAMTKSGGGTFKYVAEWHDPNTLPENVSGTYDGKAKNVQLVVSHGCRPFDESKPAWCSPGYWHGAEDAAWALTGYARSDLFNATVYDSFYGATFVADPTLGAEVPGGPQVQTSVLLTSGNTYKGPGFAGTNPETVIEPLNAFNAVGAFLTDNIPGFDYSQASKSVSNNSDTCPIDHHGNFKEVVAPV
jgi:hypothetical protein